VNSEFPTLRERDTDATSPESLLAATLRRNIAALGRRPGECAPPVKPLPEKRPCVPVIYADDDYDVTKAAWLNFRPGDPVRKEHQHQFMMAQGKAKRAGTTPDEIGLEELLCHYFWTGKYAGWYLVELPADFLEYLLREQALPSVADRAKLGDRVVAAIRLVLRCRQQGVLPRVLEYFTQPDETIEWEPLSDCPNP